MKKTNHSCSGFCMPLLTGIALILLLFSSSCTTTRQYTYLKSLEKDTTISRYISTEGESKIQPGDQLSITLSSLSPAEDEQFNKAAAKAGSAEMNGFAVDADGYVQFHRLGRVKVAGLTRRQLEDQLEQSLTGYMKEPIAHVHYLNHKVTVIGAVSNPVVLNMPEEQLNIFEVLVKAGDIKESGMKNRVMIIREDANDKKVKQVDLENHQIFNSPWYYIKPNDIVLVPDDVKSKTDAEKRQRVQTTLAMVASGISLIVIIADRIFR